MRLVDQGRARQAPREKTKWDPRTARDSGARSQTSRRHGLWRRRNRPLVRVSGRVLTHDSQRSRPAQQGDRKCRRSRATDSRHGSTQAPSPGVAQCRVPPPRTRSLRGSRLGTLILLGLAPYCLVHLPALRFGLSFSLSARYPPPFPSCKRQGTHQGY